ncbi:MAG TPA: hypothetical protein VF466_03220 [Candidatus Saccharimonadales bacterium]
MSGNVRPAAGLFLRSLAPSPIEILVVFLASLLLVGGHLLLLSLSGQAYPTNLNDVLLSGYANYIVGPVAAFLNSGALNFILLGAAWGAIGFVLYELLVHVIFFLRDLHNEGKSVNMPAEGVVRRHPLEGFLLLHVAWRLFIVILTLLFTVAIVPAVQYCLSQEDQVLSVKSLPHGAGVVAVSIGVWALVMHGYVVLLRWYMFRTRITGEILY